MKKMKKFPKLYEIINERNNKPATHCAKVIDGYIFAANAHMGIKLPVKEYGMPDGSTYTKEHLKLIRGAKNSLKFNEDNFEVDGKIYEYATDVRNRVGGLMLGINALIGDFKQEYNDAVLNIKLLKKMIDCFDGDDVIIHTGLKSSLIMSECDTDQRGIILHPRY